MKRFRIHAGHEPSRLNSKSLPTCKVSLVNTATIGDSPLLLRNWFPEMESLVESECPHEKELSAVAAVICGMLEASYVLHPADISLSSKIESGQLLVEFPCPRLGIAEVTLQFIEQVLDSRKFDIDNSNTIALADQYGEFMRWYMGRHFEISLQSIALRKGLGCFQPFPGDTVALEHENWLKPGDRTRMPTTEDASLWYDLYPQLFLVFDRNGSCLRTFSNQIECASPVGDRIAKDKRLMSQYLLAAGIPSAKSNFVHSEEELARALSRVGTPCLIKPVDDANRVGVIPDIRSVASAQRAFRTSLNQMRSHAQGVLVSPFYQGLTYRAVVVGNEVVSVFRSEPLVIGGDGLSTVRELMQGQVSRSGVCLASDEYIANCLIGADMTFDSIPRRGETVRLSLDGNDGGSFLLTTDDVCQSNKKILVEAARVLGQPVVGFDVVAIRMDQPLQKTGGVIVDANSPTGLDFVEDFGVAIDIMEKIVDFIEHSLSLCPPAVPTSSCCW